MCVRVCVVMGVPILDLRRMWQIEREREKGREGDVGKISQTLEESGSCRVFRSKDKNLFGPR